MKVELRPGRCPYTRERVHCRGLDDPKECVECPLFYVDMDLLWDKKVVDEKK